MNRNLSNKITILTLSFCLSTAALFADNDKSNLNKKDDVNSIKASTKVQLVKSSENIEIATKDGNQVILPKIDKVLIDVKQPLALTNQNLLANAKIMNEEVQNKWLLNKEISELSSLLGIKITDASFLDFYKEVADWLGTKYVWGGMSRRGVDCSGFTGIIYNAVFGQKLDRVSTTMAANVKESIYAKEDLIPGDLVFFSTFGKKYINHVGLYIGEGYFIHANIKRGVIVSSLTNGYYSGVWRKGGRM